MKRTFPPIADTFLLSNLQQNVTDLGKADERCILCSLFRRGMSGMVGPFLAFLLGALSGAATKGGNHVDGEGARAVGSVSEGWEAATRQAVERASRTLRNIRSVWVKEFEAVVENNGVTQFRVNVKISFELEEAGSVE